MLARPAITIWKTRTTIIQPLGLVNRLTPYPTSRSVHSEPVKQPTHLVKVREQSFIRFTDPRQVTLEANRPSIISKNQVLEALRDFCMTEKSWARFIRNSQLAFVILATPRFSKWLEDDEYFIPEFLKTVAHTSRSEKVLENQKSQNAVAPFEIDVLCACVDGLSPGIDWISTHKARSVKEGFSILQGGTDEILPNLWKPEGSTTSSTPGIQSSLTFSANRETHITLPLANTLFSNGRHSTLLVSRWRGQDGSFIKVRGKEKRNQLVKIFDSERLRIPPSFVPAIPLTPARRIKSGLGNIVRQIDFGEEGHGPASRELEANINEYLETTGSQKSAIAVWALIIPAISQPNQAREPPPYKLLLDMDLVKSYWQISTPSNEFVGYWIDRGAKFCRVLSGGGGWGTKQGLLSLDPQTTYSDIDESRFDFSNGSLKDQQASALGDIAQPGAYIQFFISDNKGKIPSTSKLPKPSAAHAWGMSTVIGTVPSTVDDLPASAPPDTSKKPDMVGQAGHFGAVSESGMFVSAPPLQSGKKGFVRNTGIHTKIDLPFSYFYRDLRLEFPETNST